MEIAKPGLKVEGSDAVMVPAAVKVTLGAISLIMHAERIPLLPILALKVPMGAL